MAFSIKSLWPRGKAGRRLVAIDAIRGAAMLGVIVYHFVWDLRYFGLLAFPVEQQVYWIAYQKLLAGSFIMLVGASLVLAHGEGIRWPNFWRRFAIIAGAALLTSAGTYAFWAEAFVYFGILHAIALFSLMGLLFLRLERRVVALIGLGFVLPSIFLAHPAFNQRALSWIGFWEVPPLTSDLVPVFPWFGITLWGIALMSWLLERVGKERIALAGGSKAVLRPLAFVGRWTLPIYLVHQMVLVGVLSLVAGYVNSQPEVRNARFLGECVQSCEIGEGSGGFCQSYCQCSLGLIEDGNLWDAISVPQPKEDQRRSVGQVVRLCSAMARDDAAAAGGN